MPRSFKVETFFGTETCTLSAGKYADNGHIALQLWCAEGPFATLTVNLRETRKYPGNFAFVDTNNAPWAESLIKRLKWGNRRASGRIRDSAPIRCTNLTWRRSSGIPARYGNNPIAEFSQLWYTYCGNFAWRCEDANNEETE